MAGLIEIFNRDLLYGIAFYFGELALRVVPVLVAAIFIAESARIWLGEERLITMLTGRHIWAGRLRAAVLGAVLPFCECGAFPVMLGLIRAGVPAGPVLAFFLVSPVVSMPAFMILIAVFGYPLALVYFILTTGFALAGSVLLENAGNRLGIFKEGITLSAGSERISLPTTCGTSYSETTYGRSCCPGETAVAGFESQKDKLFDVAGQAWIHTVKLLRKIFPYMGAVILVSALLHNLVPRELIHNTLAAGAPFDILIGAVAGIPIYTGDCAMIALAAPLIGATGAVGAGIAFIISGSGTSISGIIFMSSVFKRQFLLIYVFTVFFIALIVGYLVSALVTLGLF